jgi:hypothetical protein
MEKPVVPENLRSISKDIDIEEWCEFYQTWQCWATKNRSEDLA